MRLRQVALAAHALGPVVGPLRAVFGLEVPYEDPGVGVFGLVNAVLPVGRDFLEVVSPVRPDASAARWLARRGGDAGYMLLFETPDLARDRKRLAELGVRIVWEANLADIAAVHLHPKDVGGAIVSFDQPVPPGAWRWGGPGWESRIRTDNVQGLAGAELASREPAGLAARWARALGGAAEPVAGGHAIPLAAGGELRFVAGAGEDALVGVTLRSARPARVLAAARARGLAVTGDAVEIGGVRFRLRS